MRPARVLNLALNALVVVGLAWAAATFVRLDDLERAFVSVGWPLALLALLLGACYTVFKGFVFVWLTRAVAALPALSVLRAYVAGEAMVLLPGGVAARVGLLGQLGVPVARAAVPVLLASLLDLAFFLVAALGVAVATPASRSAALLVAALVLAVGALLAAVFARPGARAWLGRRLAPLLARARLAEAGARFAGALRLGADPRVWGGGFVLTMLAFGVKLAVLDLCLRGVGISLSPPSLLVVYVLPTLLGRVTPIPAGAGVTEAGMVGVLVQDGANPGAALAASVLFRTAVVFFPALVGGLVYALDRGRRPPGGVPGGAPGEGPAEHRETDQKATQREEAECAPR